MKLSKWAICVFCVMLVGFMFSISPVFGQAKPIELTYSNFFPAPHKNAVLSVEWGKEIEKRTNGRVKVTVFPGGTLTPAAQCYDGVVKGLSDVGLSVLGYTRGRFPLTEVIDLPSGLQEWLGSHQTDQHLFKQVQTQRVRRRESHVPPCPWTGHPPHQETCGKSGGT